MVREAYYLEPEDKRKIRELEEKIKELENEISRLRFQVMNPNR